MEKIDYYCGQQDLPYEFPSRQWYENSKKSREVQILLPGEAKGELPFSVLVHIREEITDEKEPEMVYRKKSLQDAVRDRKSITEVEKPGRENRSRIRSSISTRLYPEELARLYQCALQGPDSHLYQYEKMICFDGGQTECFVKLLSMIAGRLNRLVAVTGSPFAYQKLFDCLMEENGLAAYCVSRLPGYSIKTDSDTEGRMQRESESRKERGITCILYGDFSGKLPIHALDYGCHFWDLSFDNRYEREILIKRPDITCFAMGKFLDTTVKLRYNTLVKEGNVNHYIIEDNNKKLRNLERE